MKHSGLDQRIEAARKAVLTRRLVDLPAERLKRMHARLDDEQRALVERLETIREDVDQALDAADYLGYDDGRTKATDTLRQLDRLRDARRQIGDAWCERVFADRLLAALGSPLRSRIYDAVMVGLIVLVVALLGIELAVGVDPRTAFWFDLVDVGACILFIGDFFWRMQLAPDKSWYWRHYWLDLVTSIPFPTSPLRAGRLVRLTRLLRLVRLLRAVRILFLFWRGLDPLFTALDVQVLRRSFAGLVAVLVIGAFGIWWLEGGLVADPSVGSVGQSAWWSFTTVVTGGFGDLHNPTTLAGRILTALLVIAGIVVVGVFTATLTSVLVREEETTAAVLALDQRLDERLNGLQAAIEATLPQRDDDPGAGPR